MFQELSRPLPQRDDGLLPTLLKVTNAAVDAENDTQLNKLAGPIVNFAGEDGSQRSPDDPHSAKTDERHAHACKVFLDDCPAAPMIAFAVGAQVARKRIHCRSHRNSNHVHPQTEALCRHLV